jgi:hypothetical protein
MSADKGKKPFKEVASATGAAAGAPTIRTGRAEVDQLLDLLAADGYELRDMMMPFPLVVIGLHNPAQKRFVLIVSKDGDEPVETPMGATITEPVVFVGADDADAGGPLPEPVTVKAYLVWHRMGHHNENAPKP